MQLTADGKQVMVHVLSAAPGKDDNGIWIYDAATGKDRAAFALSHATGARFHPRGMTVAACEECLPSPVVGIRRSHDGRHLFLNNGTAYALRVGELPD